MATFIFLTTCIILSYTAPELRQLHVRSRPTTLRGLEDVPISPGDKSEKWTTGFVMRKPEGVLYYEILKRMRYRNLTFSDIQEVLSQKDDADQFMYMLADKLGYIVDNNYDDPHIAVIKSFKDDLMALLEKKQRKYLNPTLQQSQQESTVTTNPPAPALDSDNSIINIEVIKAIRSLTSVAIDKLLNYAVMPGLLPQAVGIAIGYSDKDEHMKYLKNMDENRLKTLLQWTLASKTHGKNVPSFDTQTTDKYGKEWQQVSGGSIRGENAYVPTKGSIIPSELGGDLQETQPSESGTQTVDGVIAENKIPKKAGGVSLKESLGDDYQGDEPPQQNRKNKNPKEGEAAQKVGLEPIVEGGGGEGDPGENKDEEKPILKGSQEKPVGDKAMDHFLFALMFLVENKDFMDFLQSTCNHTELYKQLVGADPSEDVINEAMEEYQKWIKELKKGGSRIKKNKSAEDNDKGGTCKTMCIGVCE